MIGNGILLFSSYVPDIDLSQQYVFGRMSNFGNLDYIRVQAGYFYLRKLFEKY